MHQDFCGSPEGKRPSEIPTGKWACSMNMDFKDIKWCRGAQDSDNWQAVVMM